MIDVVVLEFARSPRLFFELILTSDLLLEHREAMLAVGRTCWFANKTKLLATPDDVNAILYMLSHTSAMRFDDGTVVTTESLEARHVFVSLSLEAVFMDALAATRGTGNEGGKCKDNVKVRRRLLVACPPGPRMLVACPPGQWLCNTDGVNEILGVDDTDSEDTDSDDDEITVDDVLAMSTALAVALDFAGSDSDYLRDPVLAYGV
jgi:hypothetical protein